MNDAFALTTPLAVKVRMWHNPVALATGQPVRLLGYFGLSLMFCVSQPVQRAVAQFRSS